MITLKTLPKATEQEVFDQVARHLLTQRTQSTSSATCGCAYRAGELKCAVGCLIGDDEYDPTIEGQAWMVLADDDRVPDAHAQLLCALQSIHDNEAPLRWSTHLYQLGQSRGLDTTCVTRFYCLSPKDKNCDCPPCGGFND